MHNNLESVTRSVLTAGMIALAASGAVHAQQTWPNKPVRVIVPYAPGGTADTLGRVVTRQMGDTLKQAFVVENRAGAAGLIGSQMVVKAEPDGYTLVVSGIGSHVVGPIDNPTAFDPMREASHIAYFGGPPTVLVVNAAVPATDLKSFITYVGTLKDGLSWGSPGQGTHGHLIGEGFRSMSRLKMVHIGYKGAGPAVLDLLANQIPAAFMTWSSASTHVKSGKLRAIAVTSAKRLPDMPELPTMGELGFPKLTGTTWFSLSGPAGMSRALVDKINGDVQRALETPEVKRVLAAQNIETVPMDAAAFTNFFSNEIERWAPLVKANPAPK